MGPALLKNLCQCGDGQLDRVRKGFEFRREFEGVLDAPVHDGRLVRRLALVKVG